MTKLSWKNVDSPQECYRKGCSVFTYQKVSAKSGRVTLVLPVCRHCRSEYDIDVCKQKGMDLKFTPKHNLAHNRRSTFDTEAQMSLVNLLS